VTRALIAIVLLAAAACDAPTVDTSGDGPAVGGPSASSVAAVSAYMPKLRIEGLNESGASLDAESAATDAIDPASLATLLTTHGFQGGRERVYAGRNGPFARVVVRKWVFEDGDGAGAFLSWLHEHPRQLIGDAMPVDTAGLPSSVTLVEHEPSGCCHEEVPIYLASWQDDETVWTVRASGPRISHTNVIGLTKLIEHKVQRGV